MKKIIVPVDFSITAKCSKVYRSVFKSINGEVLLYHVFHLPVAQEWERPM